MADRQAEMRLMLRNLRMPAIAALFPTVGSPVLSVTGPDVTAAHPNVAVTGVVVVTRRPRVTRALRRHYLDLRVGRCHVNVKIDARVAWAWRDERGLAQIAEASRSRDGRQPSTHLKFLDDRSCLATDSIDAAARLLGDLRCAVAVGQERQDVKFRSS